MSVCMHELLEVLLVVIASFQLVLMLMVWTLLELLYYFTRRCKLIYFHFFSNQETQCECFVFQFPNNYLLSQQHVRFTSQVFKFGFNLYTVFNSIFFINFFDEPLLAGGHPLSLIPMCFGYDLSGFSLYYSRFIFFRNSNSLGRNSIYQLLCILKVFIAIDQYF